MREHKNNKRPRNIYFGKQQVRSINKTASNKPIPAETSKQERQQQLIEKFNKLRSTSKPDKKRNTFGSEQNSFYLRHNESTSLKMKGGRPIPGNTAYFCTSAE